ncbi:hypothetical protein H5410_023835 [Solanum commersonii]|uniref:Uncharacterized protein n=1 Tax=Solanum commersonii TaxID=4109 RepID=A0A9J5ZK94_SOLCO|nr:hypothetical protein H5410_023835 [Solanum commersonii]
MWSDIAALRTETRLAFSTAIVQIEKGVGEEDNEVVVFCYTCTRRDLLSVRDEIIDLEAPPDSYVPAEKEVVEQEIKKRKKEVSRATSFADKGLPLDPHLRMLKQNPSFLKIERKPQGGNKGKKVIDSSN